MNATVPTAWDFAVSLYSGPGVRDACLALQDRRGADVVALMALLHAAVAGRGPPSEERLRVALSAVAPWRARAVLPLRAIRRALKDWRFEGDPGPAANTETARRAVASAELEAERVELEALSATLAGGGPTRFGAEARPAAGAAAAAALALACYWRVAGLAADGKDCAHLAILLAAAFPMTADAAMEHLARAIRA